MTVYRDAAQAIARVMSIETIDGTAIAEWQKHYQSGWPELRGKGCGLTSSERLAQDSMTRALLHRELRPVVWHALVAGFSINDLEVAESVRWLAPRIESPAHHLFRLKCTTAWARPKKRGTTGQKTSTSLPDAFYELHTWDNNGTPEGTLRRWRAVTKRWLDDRVAEGFQEVGQILNHRELFCTSAA